MAGAAIRVPAEDIARWRQANGLGAGAAVALAPGSVGASKRWTYYPEAARLLAEHGLEVWVVGGPGEKGLAQEIVAAGGARVRDLTGTDLRNGILAMAAASVAISNDSGLMHIAAALGTPTMGIFGPTSPYHWAPLNGLAATVQNKTQRPLPALPAPDLQHERPPLHAGYRGLRGRGDRAAGARSVNSLTPCVGRATGSESNSRSFRPPALVSDVVSSFAGSCVAAACEG